MEEIKKTDLSTYINIRMNISAIWKKTRIAESEKAFFYGDNKHMDIYKIGSDGEVSFRSYFTFPAGECYLCVRHDKRFATAFSVNSSGYVQAQKYIFHEMSVHEICYIFDQEMTKTDAQNQNTKPANKKSS